MELPENFDVIIVGTGMPECIIAAAAARIGKTVLHLDRNGYYGGDWASFSYDKFVEWIDEIKGAQDENVTEPEIAEITLQEGEIAVACPTLPKSITNLISKAYIRERSERSDLQPEVRPDLSVSTHSTEGGSDPTSEGGEPSCAASTDATAESAEEITEVSASNNLPQRTNQVPAVQPVEEMDTSEQWTLNDFFENRRKFNIDLAPKLLFARGSLVELLISSNIARYAEFQCISRVLTCINGHIEQVPCSRADVFSTKNVTVVEKRMLMKLLNFCLKFEENEEEYKGFEDRPFEQFLKSKKLTENVEHYVMNAIAMVDETCTTIEGLKATQKFLQSLGRYGKTPFLCTCYGSAELPQCFCRLCAVYEGLYYLKRKADCVIMKEDKCCGVVSRGLRISCQWLVMESSYAPTTFFSVDTSQRISRGILVADGSISLSERKESTILRIPPGFHNENTITVIEFSSKNYVCPEDLYLVYLFCKSSKPTAEDDLKSVAELLFPTANSSAEGESRNRSKLLWSVYFNQLDTSCQELDSPEGIFLTSSPDAELDYEHAVKEAERIFSSMYPGEEFLPRAPDPEDIVIENCNNPGDGDGQKIENDVKDDEAGESHHTNEGETGESCCSKEEETEESHCSKEEETGESRCGEEEETRESHCGKEEETRESHCGKEEETEESHFGKEEESGAKEAGTGIEDKQNVVKGDSSVKEE